MEKQSEIAVNYLSENLRALRKRMELSQEELAEKVGLNRGNIASYENGSAEPKICNLIKIAHLYNVPIHDLIHSNLRDEDGYAAAVQRKSSGAATPIDMVLSSYFEEVENYESAIKGLQCMFKLKLNNLSDIPEEMAFMKENFEQLHFLATDLLSSYQTLLSTIKCKCQSSEVNHSA